MVKSPCCKEVGLKKGPWKPEEDQKLLAYIERHGHGSWRTLPAKAGLQRCGKSCRLRWTNYLRPDIRRGKFSLQEEQTIIQLHALLGNRWSAIAAQLSKRTDNEIKNYWNTHLKKRLTKMGIDPMTHKPKTNALLLGRTQDDIANLNHIAQWESARVEAEARLVKESKLLSSKYPYLHHHHLRHRHHPSTTSVPFPASKQPMTTMLPCLDILKAWQGLVWTNNNNHNNNNFGTLESPTSVLHNNVLIAGGATASTATTSAAVSTAAGSAGLDNSVFLTTDMKAKENYSDPQKNAITNWDCSNEGNNNDHEVDHLMLLHGINDGSFPVDTPPCIPAGSSDQLLPSFPEGVVVTADDDDLLLDGVAGIFSSINGLYVDSCSGGNLEDNNKYWKY